MTSSHALHQHIYSHAKNCTIGFCSRWRLYILYDSINSFTLAYFRHTRVPEFYFQLSSFTSSNQATIQFLHFTLHDPITVSAIFLLHSSSTFWVSGGMLFSNLYPCNSLNARKWMNLENFLTLLHYLIHFHKPNTS